MRDTLGGEDGINQTRTGLGGGEDDDEAVVVCIGTTSML